MKLGEREASEWNFWSLRGNGGVNVILIRCFKAGMVATMAAAMAIL